jgi:hypothetical protein
VKQLQPVEVIGKTLMSFDRTGEGVPDLKAIIDDRWLLW